MQLCRLIVVGLCCALAAEASAKEATDEVGTARFVIAVGYNAAEPDPRPTLSYADDDAARFFEQQGPTAEKSWLLTTFDAESAAAYPDLSRVASPPSLVELARALGEVTWRARARKAEGVPTELVFYFAGHGDVTPAGEGFLVLPDGRLTREDLFRQLVEGSPTDVNHIILDACASYFMVNARSAASSEVAGRPLTPALLDAIKADAARERPEAWARTGVLVSTSSSAAVHESADLGSGVFSYLLRSALTGAADLNDDGRLEYGEVAAFIASASAGIEDPRARVAVHASAPVQRPHAPLADLTHPAFDRFLRVARDGPSRVRLLDARGLPYAELHRQPGRGVTLALVGGPYFVVQRGDSEALLVPRSPGAYALSALEFYDAPRRRGGGVASRLFGAAFGAAFADGFFAGSAHLPPTAQGSFAPPWAEGGAPGLALTPAPFALLVLGAAGTAAAVSLGALGANLVAFVRLQQIAASTGQVDPTWAVAVEVSRLAAYGAGALALSALVAAGGLGVWAVVWEDDE